MDISKQLPGVSVVIPVFNGARYLRRAVDSVLSQTSPATEILVVDDGSTDNPGAVLKPYETRVRHLIHEKNKGLAATRNTGIAAAQCDILAFLDVDDWWEPTKLAEQLRLFGADEDLDVVFSDFDQIMPDGEFGNWRGGLLQQLQKRGLRAVPVCANGFRLEGELAHALIVHTSFMHPSTMTLRRRALERAGTFDESWETAEDLQLWIRLALKCRIGLVDRVLAHTEQRPDSLGRSRFRMARDLLRLYESLPSVLTHIPANVHAAIGRAKAREHRALAWEYEVRGDRPLARRHYRAAFALEPKVGTLLSWAKAWVPNRVVNLARVAMRKPR